MTSGYRVRLRPGTFADADLLDAWAASVAARGPSLYLYLRAIRLHGRDLQVVPEPGP